MNPKSSPSSMAISRPAQFAHEGQPPSLEALLVTLRTGDFQSRWDVAKSLPGFGEAAIAPLVELLQEAATEEEDWELCWFIARILGEFKHPATIDSLLDLLQTTQDREIATMAATALTQLGPSAIPPLAQLLTQASKRSIAIESLARIQHPEVLPLLLEVVNDELPEIRVAAITAVSHFYGPSVNAVLLSALQDSHAQVRRAAVIGLGIQASQWTNLSIDRQQDNSFDATQLVQALEPLLWDLNLEICSQTAIALARIGNADAVSRLANMLQSAHTPQMLRLEIIRALAWIGNVPALEPLQQFLDQLAEGRSANPDSEPLLNQLALEVIAVLGRLESPEAQQSATKILLNLLQTAHPIVHFPRGKQQIALSLGQLDQAEAIEALILFLADAENSVRFHAIAALKQLAAHGSHQRLQALMSESSTPAALRTGITVALQEW